MVSPLPAKLPATGRDELMAADSAMRAVYLIEDESDVTFAQLHQGYPWMVMDLHLYDARGTASTRLLNAGPALAELASHIGWSLRHAAVVIGAFLLVPEAERDTILHKLEAADAKAGRKKL